MFDAGRQPLPYRPGTDSSNRLGQRERTTDVCDRLQSSYSGGGEQGSRCWTVDIPTSV